MSKMASDLYDASLPAQPPAAQEHFLEVLGDVQQRLDASGVDYRVLGSVAAATLLQSTPYQAATQLDFERPGAHTPDQRVPDIDLLLPRSDVPLGRELRDHYMKGKYPVKLGVALGQYAFDFRPDQTTSVLRRGDIAIPFNSEVLKPSYNALSGINVRTVGADALLHTYVTAGGLLRRKDIPAVRGLIEVATELGRSNHAADFAPFHQFISERNRQDPSVRRHALVQEALKDKIPPRAYNAAMTVALSLASRMGRR